MPKRTATRAGFEQLFTDMPPRPGSDPRTWVAICRVDDDPNAIQWSTSELGWLVDVTPVTGTSAGDGPINCRVASSVQRAQTSHACPVAADTLVVVVFPSGDSNEDAVIIGQLHDVDAAKAPSTVNGDTIVETSTGPGSVGVDETHITVAPTEDLDQEWRNVRVTATGLVNLGIAIPEESYMRGDTFMDALDTLMDAFDAYLDALALSAPAPPNAALTVADAIAAGTPLITAISNFKSARSTYLSTKIKGD